MFTIKYKRTYRQNMIKLNNSIDRLNQFDSLMVVLNYAFNSDQIFNYANNITLTHI